MLVLTLAASLCFAYIQPQPQANPQPEAAKPVATQPADPLAGHPVEQAAPKATIVERDFQGNVRRPDATPVEAALSHLDLSDDARARVAAVLGERARLLEDFVASNLDLLTRFGAAENSTDQADKLLLALEAFQKLAPIRVKGPLESQVRAALPPPQAQEFDRLLSEYWRALAEEDRHAPKPKGRLGTIIEEKLKALGREIEAAFHRSERSGAVLYHYLFADMALSPEQSKRLHQLCATYSANGLDNQDKGAQSAFFVAATQALEPKQRAVLIKKLKGG